MVLSTIKKLFIRNHNTEQCLKDDLINSSSIYFSCWTEGEEYDLCIEPYASIFKVEFGHTITLICINPCQNFQWWVRHDKNYIQIGTNIKTANENIFVLLNDKPYKHYSGDEISQNDKLILSKYFKNLHINQATEKL